MTAGARGRASGVRPGRISDDDLWATYVPRTLPVFAVAARGLRPARRRVAGLRHARTHDDLREHSGDRRGGRCAAGRPRDDDAIAGTDAAAPRPTTTSWPGCAAEAARRPVRTWDDYAAELVGRRSPTHDRPTEDTASSERPAAAVPRPSLPHGPLPGAPGARSAMRLAVLAHALDLPAAARPVWSASTSSLATRAPGHRSGRWWLAASASGHPRPAAPDGRPARGAPRGSTAPRRPSAPPGPADPGVASGRARRHRGERPGEVLVDLAHTASDRAGHRHPAGGPRRPSARWDRDHDVLPGRLAGRRVPGAPAPDERRDAPGADRVDRGTPSPTGRPGRRRAMGATYLLPELAPERDRNPASARAGPVRPEPDRGDRFRLRPDQLRRDDRARRQRGVRQQPRRGPPLRTGSPPSRDAAADRVPGLARHAAAIGGAPGPTIAVDLLRRGPRRRPTERPRDGRGPAARSGDCPWCCASAATSPARTTSRCCTPRSCCGARACGSR